MSTGIDDQSIFETHRVDEFIQYLTTNAPHVVGASCALTEPKAVDWNQTPSDNARWAERFFKTLGIPRPSTRPVCVLTPAGDRDATRVIATGEAIEEAIRRLRVVQAQEIERRERAGLPNATPGDTWIRVGFRVHQTSGSSRLVLSVCEVYVGK